MKDRLFWSVGLCAALLLGGCSESLLRESAPLPPAQLGITASFSSAGGSEPAYARTNRLHVRFTRDGAVRLEETLPFDASASEVTVPVDVTLRSATETLQLDIELRRDSDAVFRGSTPVTLSAGSPSAVVVSLEPVLASVICTGAPVLLDAIGATAQLSAAAMFITNDTIFGAPIQWTSGNPGIATVAPTGVAQAISEGETTARCSSGDLSDTRAIRVAAAVSTVEVVPAQLSLERDATQSLAAVVRDRLGSVIAGRAVVWSSSAPAVATVSSAGVVTALSAGSARIDATAEGVTASAAITVRNRAPSVTTGGVQVTGSTATITGTVNPHGIATDAWFEFGTSTGLGNTTASSAAGSGSSPVTVSRELTGLVPGATYFYRVVARNEAGQASGAVRELLVPISISVTPATATTSPGLSVTFTASVSGTTNTSVSWESSNPAIATVDAQGVASAHELGTTTITATAVADPTRRATATLNVENAAAVNISSVVSQPAGTAVNPSAVTGMLDIAVEVSAETEHDVRSLGIYLDDAVVCSRTFPQPLSTGATPLTVDCSADTRDASEDGVPRFVNGARTLRAVAYSSTGVVAAQDEFCAVPGCTLMLSNSDTFRLAVAGTGTSQVDAAGRTWWQSFAVQVTPIVYAAGDYATNIVLMIQHDGGVLSQSIGPLSTPARHVIDVTESILSGIEAEVLVRVRAVTASGAELISPDPATYLEYSVLVDNLAPRLNSLWVPPHGGWAGGSFPLGGDAEDGGVGAAEPSILFDVVAASAPTGAAVTGGSAVVHLGSVTESASSLAYGLRVTVSDLLGNSETYYAMQDGGWDQAPQNLSLFGVDNTAPTIGAEGPPANSVNWGSGWWLMVADPPGSMGTSSGVYPDSVRARLVRYSANYPSGVCVNPASAAREIISAIASSPACFVSLDPVEPYVTAPEWEMEDEDYGYFLMTAYVVDYAGNRSATLTRTTLFDLLSPSIGAITGPSSISGNQPVTFSAPLSDNVDLGDAAAVLGFTGDTAVWLVQGRTVLSGYGLPLRVSATVPLTVPSFIRSITETWDGGYISTRVSLARWIEYVVRDQAQLREAADCSYFWSYCEAQQLDIGGAVAAGLGSGSVRDWTQLAQTDPNVRFVLNVPQSTLDPDVSIVRAEIRGSAGTFVNPFQRVVFYMRPSGSAGHRAERLGQGAVTVSEDSVSRTYTFTSNMSAEGFPDGLYDIFALGVDANGDALMTETVWFYRGDPDDSVSGVESPDTTSQITASARVRQPAPSRSGP